MKGIALHAAILAALASAALLVIGFDVDGQSASADDFVLAKCPTPTPGTPTPTNTPGGSTKTFTPTSTPCVVKATPTPLAGTPTPCPTTGCIINCPTALPGDPTNTPDLPSCLLTISVTPTHTPTSPPDTPLPSPPTLTPCPTTGCVLPCPTPLPVTPGPTNTPGGPTKTVPPTHTPCLLIHTVTPEPPTITPCLPAGCPTPTLIPCPPEGCFRPCPTSTPGTPIATNTPGGPTKTATVTATPCFVTPTPPVPVGGIVLGSGPATLALEADETRGGSLLPWFSTAGVAAAIALVCAAWYAHRRWGIR